MNENWETIKLGEVLELNYGKSLPKSERIKGKYPVFGSNGIIDYHDKALVKGPGIIVGRKGSCGEVHYANEDFYPIDTTYYVALRSDANLQFIAYLLSSLNLSEMNYHSTIPGLNRESVYQMECDIPPVFEQKKIASILYKIKKEIEAQEAIIRTTKELKKSTMHHLFTRGLYGEKTKQTAIGEIPESWEVVQIKDLGEIITGTTPPTINQGYYNGGGYQFISPADLGENINIYNAEKQISEKGLIVSRILSKHSICCVCIGSTIGKVGITVTEQSATNQQINAIIANNNYDPYFIAYLLDYTSPYIASFASPSPVPILSKGKYADIPIMITSNKDEQKEIAKILITIDNKIMSNEFIKNKLQELFNSLLNKLMTGEIRVNDLKINSKET